MKPERLTGFLRLSKSAQTKPGPLRVVVIKTERNDTLPEQISKDLEDLVPVARM